MTCNWSDDSVSVVDVFGRIPWTMNFGMKYIYAHVKILLTIIEKIIVTPEKIKYFW